MEKRTSNEKKGKVVPEHAMNMCRGSSCIAAVILNLNTRWW
jgi:hypothetical protein